MNYRKILSLLVWVIVFESAAWGNEGLKDITCSPKVLYQGDVLNIEMSTPHGGYLAIVNAQGIYFFVVYPSPETNKPSLFSSEDFKNMSEIQIRTDSTKAAPWVFSRNENELIFTKPGKYRVIVGENLESDAGYPRSECEVQFTDNARPT